MDKDKLAKKIIRDLHRLSKNGKLKWAKDELGIYRAKHKKLKVSVERYNFHRMDERSSDDSILELSIQVAKKKKYHAIIFTYSIGTKEFELIHEMLSFSFKDWRESWTRGKKKKKKILAYLNKI